MPEFAGNGQPKQNNYQTIINGQIRIEDEMFIMRKTIEELGQATYDITAIMGMLAKAIAEWVGVDGVIDNEAFSIVVVRKDRE